MRHFLLEAIQYRLLRLGRRERDSVEVQWILRAGTFLQFRDNAIDEAQLECDRNFLVFN